MLKSAEVLTVLEFDGLTNKTTIRELTAEELAQRKQDQTEAKARQSEVDAKVAARDSALAKLAALGLSAEEIAAL
jgi:DNA-binding NarL/FixJ family response regulator